MGHTLAARRRQRIVPDQELIGLGASNMAAAFSGGYPVTGGFARSIVNFDAGAATPASGILTALGIALSAVFFTPYLAYLPNATLAATIIVAVLSLVDFSILKRTWDYGLSDFVAVAITIFVTLGFGVETGVRLRCAGVAGAAPVQDLAAAHGGGGRGAGYRALPQCRPPRGDYPQRHPLPAHR